MDWSPAESRDPPMLPIDYPGERPVEALEDEITELYGHITAATSRLLVLIAELDRRGRYGKWGLRSCAHWLNYKCGISMGAAREKVRVARALPGLPQISAAFAAGEVSYSKVRAMSRVATPENESYLLMIARHGTAWHVESLVREYRSVQRVQERARAEKQHAERNLRYYWDDDGSLVIKGRLPPEQGVLFIKALEAARESQYQDGAWTYIPGIGTLSASKLLRPGPKTFPRERLRLSLKTFPRERPATGCRRFPKTGMCRNRNKSW